LLGTDRHPNLDGPGQDLGQTPALFGPEVQSDRKAVLVCCCKSHRCNFIDGDLVRRHPLHPEGGLREPYPDECHHGFHHLIQLAVLADLGPQAYHPGLQILPGQAAGADDLQIPQLPGHQ
jgi:hypothetical protein